MGLLSIIIIAVAAVAGIYWCLQGRSQNAVEDPEIMRIRATQGPQLHAAYAKRRAELLETLKEPLLVETEEALFNESVVWRRQLQANTSPENIEKCKFHIDNLRHLHASWELEHPELKELHEEIGNIREALFILEYGTPVEIRKLMANAKALGSGADS
jgi:hypothetical protein